MKYKITLRKNYFENYTLKVYEKKWFWQKWKQINWYDGLKGPHVALVSQLEKKYNVKHTII